MSQNCLEEILAHMFRSMEMKSFQRVGEVLTYPSVVRLVHYIDSDLHLFTVSQVAFPPGH